MHQTVKDGAIREYTFGHRPYSAVELSTLLGSVGFEDIHVFGAFQGRAYHHEAERLVCLARRSPEPRP